jgi:release factor glutamine methyltransferase
VTGDGAGMARAQDLLRRHLHDPAGRREVTVLGRRWDLLDGVFSPAFTPVTELFTSWLPYPSGGSFLDMGCGAGVTSVVAAESGCRAVTAADISTAAVANTRCNAARYGVEDRVRVVRSDMFAALGPDERFDLVFWNSNFVHPPAGFVNRTELDHAFFDPMYAAHRAYLRDGPAHLTEGGRLLLGFSNLGSSDLLRELCAEAGLEVNVLRVATRQLEITIEFQLLELVS